MWFTERSKIEWIETNSLMGLGWMRLKLEFGHSVPDCVSQSSHLAFNLLWWSVFSIYLFTSPLSWISGAHLWRVLWVGHNITLLLFSATPISYSYSSKEKYSSISWVLRFSLFLSTHLCAPYSYNWMFKVLCMWLCLIMYMDVYW
jgi:hypothetical protein